MDEIAIGDSGLVAGAEEIGDSDGEVGKVDAASEETNDWHNDIIDKRIDDSSKSTAYGNAYGEIDDGAAVDEFDEFFAEAGVVLVSFLESFFGFGASFGFSLFEFFRLVHYIFLSI